MCDVCCLSLSETGAPILMNNGSNQCIKCLQKKPCLGCRKPTNDTLCTDCSRTLVLLQCNECGETKPSSKMARRLDKKSVVIHCFECLGKATCSQTGYTKIYDREQKLPSMNFSSGMEHMSCKDGPAICSMIGTAPYLCDLCWACVARGADHPNESLLLWQLTYMKNVDEHGMKRPREEDS